MTDIEKQAMLSKKLAIFLSDSLVSFLENKDEVDLEQFPDRSLQNIIQVGSIAFLTQVLAVTLSLMPEEKWNSYLLGSFTRLADEAKRQIRENCHEQQ